MAAVETNDERRRRKLIELCRLHGGAAGVVKGTDLSPEAIEQVVRGTLLPKKRDGTQSPRALGDSAARAIEGARQLGRGWFDNDSDGVEMTANELLLLGHFRQLDAQLQALVIENVRDAAEQRQRIAEQLGRVAPPKPDRPKEPTR